MVSEQLVVNVVVRMAYARTSHIDLEQAVAVSTVSVGSWKQEPLMAVEPHRPPMTKVGTGTAFRHDHCKFQ